MTDHTVIENKISSLQKYLGILKRYQQYSQQEILNDIDKKGALERYLYLDIQATIDLADAIISYKNLRKPSTMSGSFHILREAAIISDEVTEHKVK
ncbi:MAG: DUF86 domain-containing protein [Nitrospiraceae bacterium]|nr:MAG: DUF86 domain-containing protein [Nitrospiraceae bacterium]